MSACRVTVHHVQLGGHYALAAHISFSMRMQPVQCGSPLPHHGLRSQVPNSWSCCSRTFDNTIVAIQDQAASLQAAQQRSQDQAQLAQEQLQRLHSARTTDLAEVWQQLDGKADMDIVRKATSGLTSGSLVQQVGQGRLGGPR